MASADGILQVVSIKKETSYGAGGTGSGARYLPFETASAKLEKPSVTDANINAHQQIANSSHGNRKGSASISADLIAGAFDLPIAAILRRDFGAISSVTGVNITIAATAPNIVRASGSFITDGFRVGQIIAVSGSATASNNKRAIVTAVTATGLTAIKLDGTSWSAVASAAGVTIAVPGKTTYAPLTGHTSDSFAIEDWQPDVAVSKTAIGMIPNTIGLNLSPNANAKISLEFIGKDVTTATSKQQTSPTAAPSNPTYNSATGQLFIDGVYVPTPTGFNVSIAGNVSQLDAMGGVFVAKGLINANGTLNVVLSDDTYLAYFEDETEVSMSYVFNDAATSQQIAIHMPRVKINSADVDSGAGKVRVVTCSFQAQKSTGASTVAGIEETTIQIQDTSLS